MDELRDIIIKYLYRYSISKIGISDILEIIILGVIVYQVIKWLHFTRAWTLFKGIFVILVFAMVAVIFQLDTITWLLSNSLSVAIIAVVVIFQPELRRVLEQLGRRNMIRLFISSSDEYSDDSKVISEKTITEIIKASFEMGKARTGALMVIEQSVALGEYERTGITVDGVVTNQLLINIFEHNTPLHDGAVIIRGNRIVSATCYLPLTDSMELGKELGTRHRAAVGISEVSDSTTVVVSEETGAVSVTKDGILYPNLNREELEEKLEHLKQGNSEGRDVFRKWKGLLHNERNEKQ
ncbi:MAG: diadenylate cyclase CdaA [Clostridiales bacterium]|nr:diadenylate cyclase CdaA [Clostridiales bacterium]